MKTKIIMFLFLLTVCSLFGMEVMMNKSSDRNLNENTRKPTESEMIDKKIEQTKEQMIKLCAKKISIDKKIPYNDCLEMVEKKYAIFIVEKEFYNNESAQNATASLICKKYKERRELLLKNKDVKIFRESLDYTYRSINVFRVTQVLDNGYYLISKEGSSSIIHLYAPILSMVDNAVVPDIFVQNIGIYKYTTVLGAVKTIDSYRMVAFCYDNWEID